MTPEEIVASNTRLAPSVHVLWNGALAKGRPIATVKGRRADLGTLLWVMVARRPVPTGYIVRPSCGRMLCVRPNHLRARPPPRAGFVPLASDWRDRGKVPDLRPPDSTCARGHDLLDLSILAQYPDGKRRCRACQREDDAARAAAAGQPRRHTRDQAGRYSVCLRGHELVGDNVMTERNGFRRCVTCHQLKEERKSAKRKLARAQAMAS
jgi:hypothetical protein